MSAFLSTPSARRATCPLLFLICDFYISIHALREEGDWMLLLSMTLLSNFYPRPPRGGRPAQQSAATVRYYDFYPRPPRGGRREDMDEMTTPELFLSTPSARRATAPGCNYIYPERFLSTPSARRATIPPAAANDGVKIISIHALREEGDRTTKAAYTTPTHFYPRPPRGGRHFVFLTVI